MAVFRVEKNKNYTTMSNYHLRDQSISLKAKGLLSCMLALPDSWNYSIAGLAKICMEGKDAIRSAINELEKARYIVRHQLHNEDGSFGSIEYVIYEDPRPEGEDPENGNGDDPPEPEAPQPENGNDPAPSSDFPTTGYPSTENPTQINTYQQSTKYIPPHTPQRGNGCDGRSKGKGRGSGSSALSMPKYKPKWFVRFYDLYPRKASRETAIKEWDKLKPDRDLCRMIGIAIEAQKKSVQWQDKSKIPYPATWLHNKRWQDEVVLPADTGSEGSSGGHWAPDPEVY